MGLISMARTNSLLLARAILLSACATGSTFRAGGYGGGSYSRGGAGVGIPF